MATSLYLDTARLGQMSRGAQLALLDFTRLAAEQAGSLYFDDFLRQGWSAWPGSLRRRYPKLAGWQGVAQLKQDLQRLAGADEHSRLLLANRTSQLMRCAARLLFGPCRNVLVTDLSWPSYAEILRQRAILVRAFELEYPRMKEVLLPLTAEGFAQPTGGAGPANSQTRGPISLTKMRAAGYLDDNPNAMQGLMNLGNASSNDRPRGSFPPQSGVNAPAARRAIEQIQQFINRYGEIMVEKGILAP